MGNKENEEKKDRAALLLERKKIIFNLVLFMAAFFVMIIGALTMAWFAYNASVNGTSMSVTARGEPYTIQTRSAVGYYSSIYESMRTGGVEWKISSNYNFDNHEDAINTALEETEPGIEPGDHGILEFRVNPNFDDEITVDCVFDVKAYYETITQGENNAIIRNITEIDDTDLIGYVKAHIMLFAGYDSVANKYTDLISDDTSLRRVLADQTYEKNGSTYTKIYWVWPKYLTDLTSDDDTRIIYAASERSDIIAYIADNKDGFFKDCNDSKTQVTNDLTTLSTTSSNSLYNHYCVKYDNADLDIGNKVSYVILSMKVE